MKDIDKQDLKAAVEASGKNFNLYRFVESLRYVNPGEHPVAVNALAIFSFFRIFRSHNRSGAPGGISLCRSGFAVSGAFIRAKCEQVMTSLAVIDRIFLLRLYVFFQFVQCLDDYSPCLKRSIFINRYGQKVGQ